MIVFIPGNVRAKPAGVKPAFIAFIAFIAARVALAFTRADSVKARPIFEGLQASSINASLGYQSGLMLGVYKLGTGKFILNTLLIRENLGQVPQAERLLRNLLRFAARN